jgi:hypothetical protein
MDGLTNGTLRAGEAGKISDVMLGVEGELQRALNPTL